MSLRAGPAAAVVASILLAVAGPAAAGPAAAADDDRAQGRVSEFSETPDGIRLGYSASNLEPGVGLEPETLRVSFEPAVGEPVELAAAARTIGGQTEVVRQSAVLAIDTSGSLGTAGIQAVREAATTFLVEAPPEVEVGLVTFGLPALIRVEPTTDRAAVQDVVDDLTSAGGTGLYDAVLLAVDLLPDEGVQRVVVLTDGEDEGLQDGSVGSQATLEQAQQAVQSSGVGLTAVAFGDETSTQALQTLADAGGGQLIPTSAAAGLADAFEQVVQEISTDLAVEVTVPPELRGESGNLLVTVTAGDQTLQTRSFRTLGTAPTATTPSPVSSPAEEAAAPAPPTAAQVRPVGREVLWAGLGGLVVAIVTIGVLAAGLGPRRPNPAARRRQSMALYTLATGDPTVPATAPTTGRSGTATRLGDNPLARSAVGLADRVVENRQGARRLARDLEAANIPLRPAEWLVLRTTAAAGTALLLFALSGGNVVALLLGLLLGVAVPHLVLTLRRSRREKAFLAVLPDSLGLLASGLRAGYSLPQAIDTVVSEGQEPVRSEFNRALVEMRLGVPTEDALEGIGARLASADFRWVVMAIRIQREVGGNLAELLDTVSATLRERTRLRRQVDTLSAEGRLSAWIVGALPVVFSLYLAVSRPEYLRVLYTEPMGIVFSAAGLVVFTMGVLGLRWAVKVEV